MKSLMLAVFAVLSAPAVAEPLTATHYGDQLGLIAVLIIGAVSLILARRKSA
ncbi:hypothetical protein [Ketobacter alkanivorans]|uniref:hypothetical protein n=1 Tax=Ketobacter alkanivorans TaxID=1917421 RepID=UPI0013152CD3|nr:hypothetical protein [Ketobacter alkanivorans]MCP5013709.1 hypothetical protein [Ketobacter sp.]